MKALTLTQPWATLIAIGAKRIETRSWTTSYRGPLAIHAAKGFPKWARKFTTEPECYQTVRTHPSLVAGYPTGVVLATCRLVACKLIVETKTALGPCADANRMLPPPPPECYFGDYSSGRYAWILEDVRELPEPVPAVGSLGLWEWSAEATAPVSVFPSSYPVSAILPSQEGNVARETSYITVLKGEGYEMSDSKTKDLTESESGSDPANQRESRQNSGSGSDAWIDPEGLVWSRR